MKICSALKCVCCSLLGYLILSCNNSNSESSQSRKNNPYAKYTEYSTTLYLLERSTFPDSVFQMNNLEVLSIGGMNCKDTTVLVRYSYEGKIMDSCYTLKEVPSATKNLKKLKLLSLGTNDIYEIPGFIKDFTDLKVMSFAGNPIPSLPSEVAELKNLKEVYLQDCLLTSVDPLAKLPKLEKLLLQGCPIKKLPADLSNWKHLKLLGLHRTFIGSAEQARIKVALPNCRIQFPD